MRRGTVSCTDPGLASDCEPLGAAYAAGLMSDRTGEAARETQWLRLGLVLAASLVLLVWAAVAMGASPAPSEGGQPAAGASAVALAVVDEDGDEDDEDEDGGGPKSDDDQGDGVKGGRLGRITITSIDGTNISLETEDGWTRTIQITAATKIFKGGVAATAGDLKVGDEVRIRQRRNADGSFTIVAIGVRAPKAGGEVTAISGDTITVKGRGDATMTITVTASTTYKLGPNAASKSDVKVGRRIGAEGSLSANGSFTATVVRIRLDELGGEVTATDSGTITVKRRDGSARTIHVGSATVYKVRGRDDAAALADVAVGTRLTASGVLRADGSLDAVVVRVGKVKAPKVEASPTG